MDHTALERLDTFPYRHRVSDVMTAPLVTIAVEATVQEAAQVMRARRISALIVDPDGAAGGPGVVTERDLLECVAERGAAALGERCGAIMSAPLQQVPDAAFLYVAIGRMHRHRLRHLVASDAAGRPSGMVTARGLLGQRAVEALILGDEVATAEDDAGLAAVQRRTLDLAEALLAERVTAPEVAAVIADVLRDLSARAAQLAASELEAAEGPAPAPWAFLVLGSGGRGESLLAADQDNALVHAGATPADEAWFERLGRRAAEILDAAGIPFCKGGVMASNPQWRRNLTEWERALEDWSRRAEGENLLSVDIFYDFVRVHGDLALAEALRRLATRAAQRPMLPRMLAQQLEGIRAPISVFGGLRAVEGWLDLKMHGLFPIVAGARAMALRHGVEATATAERLRAIAAAGLIGEDDLGGLLEAQELFMTLILEQQLRDLRAGRDPGTRVEPARLSPGRRRRLKEALRRAALIAHTAQDVVHA